MALVEWRDDSATGIASVDAEHRRPIDLINAGHTRVAGQGDAAPDAFLGELHDHIAAHFALEERIMRVRRYAGYTAHKADHERLLDQLREMMEAPRCIDFRPAEELLSERLRRWFVRHFEAMDARLHDALGGTPG